MKTCSRRRLSILVFAALFLLLPARAAPAAEVGVQDIVQLRPLGTGALDQGPGGPVTAGPRDTEIRRHDIEELIKMPVLARRFAALALPAFPTVENSALAVDNPGLSGFDALDHDDQRSAGSGAYANSQFSAEPPDQALCAGNGFVVEAVNTALAVYRRDGSLASGPTPLNQLFGLPPEVARAETPVFGDFTSDPRCFYDPETNRFFVTLLQIDVDPATGDFLAGSHLLLAVSKDGDPTGSWNLFSLDATADGQNCPCFGDQPLLGSDANGFYLSTNAFSLVDGNFAGVQIYAMSKLFLAAGTVPPFVLHVALPAPAPTDTEADFSVHPSVDAPGEELRHFGSEFFLSSPLSADEVQTKIVAWSLSNTVLLHLPPGPATHLQFQKLAIDSQAYGIPPDALQKIGELPLGSTSDPGVQEVLATNDERMQQPVFSRGKLWASVTSGMQSTGDSVVAGFGGAAKAGIAWFAVAVNNARQSLEASVSRQGYIALKDANLFYPALGVDRRGEAIIGFSVSGPDRFPGAGYAQLGRGGRFGDIHIAAAGVGSEDGLSGYPSFGGPCDETGTLCEARWGDYAAAAVDSDGSILFANEYIGPRPRSALANWGTFISRVTPRR
jgi:hypothetical protein